MDGAYHQCDGSKHRRDGDRECKTHRWTLYSENDTNAMEKATSDESDERMLRRVYLKRMTSVGRTENF